MKLSYAIVISLLGHGILLLSWPDKANFAVASTPASYKVTLLDRKTEKKSVIKNRNTNSKQKLAIKQQKTTLVKREIPSSFRQKQFIKTNIQPSFDAKAYVISRINYEIKNYFKYPILARRNGWQGTVMLSLSVNSHGYIENTHIKVGSGYRILDNSALDALNKVKNIPNIENWSLLKKNVIVIPVIYRLQKG